MIRQGVALTGLVIGMGLALPAVAQAQEQTGSFRLGGVAFEVPLPKGYCPPQGKAIDVAQMVAAADVDNITDLSLFPCGNDGSAANYYLVKTPKGMLATSMTRPQVLAAVGAEFDKPEFNEMLASGAINDKTSKAYTDMTRQVTTLTGQVKPLGRDETCAYLGGVLNFKTDKIAYSRAISGCITAVADRVVFVFRYSEGEPGNVFKMLPDAKAFALSIKGRPAQ
jgi:hypothetical protein